MEKTFNFITIFVVWLKKNFYVLILIEFIVRYINWSTILFKILLINISKKMMLITIIIT